tara:strand:+ start:1938 stop:2405 length:468 start_codon:yes stop_codon:yes gene_type:complete
MPEVARLRFPTAPGNAATICLVATHPGTVAAGLPVAVAATSDRLVAKNLSEVEIVWHKNDQASAANGVRAYVTDDGGTTWFETDVKSDTNAATIGTSAAVQIAALSSPAEARTTIRVSQYQGVAVFYTAGATGPTAVTGWRGTITAHLNAVSVIQ